MAKKQKLLVANWKMFPATFSEAQKLFLETRRIGNGLKRARIVVCPPSVYLGIFAHKTKKVSHRVVFGAQDSSQHASGAYTGDVSADMLKNFGVSYVILGHSERRAMGESDACIGEKIHHALDSGLTPVVCVGESHRDEHGDYLQRLQEQIQQTFHRVSSQRIERVVVAYEPIWAVGARATGIITPHELHETVLYIKKVLTQQYGRASAEKVAIIYGGSVNAKDAQSFLEHTSVDGLITGRASLDPTEIKAIATILDTLSMV